MFFGNQSKIKTISCGGFDPPPEYFRVGSGVAAPLNAVSLKVFEFYGAQTEKSKALAEKHLGYVVKGRVKWP
jgi:hypothetical protein